MNRKVIITHSTGLGVRNVQKRLQLTFGEGYRLSYHDLPDDVLEARIKLPFRLTQPEAEDNE